MLITRLRGMFRDSILFVAFDTNGDICVASNNVTETIDLEYVLYGITGKTLNEY